MPSIILSDNGASSGSAGIKSTGGNDGILQLQTTTSGGTATTAVTIDTSQNVGVGVTPFANSLSKGLDWVSGAGVFGSSNNAYWSANAYYDSAWKYKATAAAAFLGMESGSFRFNIASSGTAGNAITFTEAMRLDASGNLALNTTSPTNPANKNFTVNGGSTDAAFVLSVADTRIGQLYAASGSEVRLSAVTAVPLTFRTNDTERARIISTGYFKASNSGVYLSNTSAYHEFYNSGLSTNTCAFTNAAATGAVYGPYFYIGAQTPNNTTSYFLACDDITNTKAIIYSNGTFGSRTNSYGGISDIKLKQDIVDATSQWDDIKGLRFRKYRLKENPTGPLQLGLISQEAELVSPGLVFESPDTVRNEDGENVETGEVTKSVKYSILYMKAVVALQEAMNRIEQLEADVAALKGTQP